MKAVRLHEFNQMPVVDDVPEPTISGPMDVIVKIGGAGVCRTDLHIMLGQWDERMHTPLPYTLGHENAGWVHDVGAAPAREVRYRLDLIPVGHHRVRRPQLRRQLEGVRVGVHDDDVRTGKRGQALDSDVPEPAGADDHGGGARGQQRDGLAHRVVGGDAGVGQRRNVLGLRRRVQLYAGPGRGEQILGHAAVA